MPSSFFFSLAFGLNSLVYPWLRAAAFPNFLVKREQRRNNTALDEMNLFCLAYVLSSVTGKVTSGSGGPEQRRDEFPKEVWNWQSCDEQRTPTPVSLQQPSVRAVRSSSPFGSRVPGACPNTRRSPLTTIESLVVTVVNVPYIHLFG
jgi:hypothetical protein